MLGVVPFRSRGWELVKHLDNFRTAPLALVQLGDATFLFSCLRSSTRRGNASWKSCGRASRAFIARYAIDNCPYVVPRGREGTYKWSASAYAEEAEEVLTKELTKLVRSAARNGSTR